MKKIVYILPCLFFLVFAFDQASAQPIAREKTSEELFLNSPGGQALKEKKFDEALKEINRLMGVRKNDPYLYKTKGIILIRMGKNSTAEKFLKNALKLNPFDRQSRYYLAQLQYGRRDSEKAKEQLRFIVENPDELGYYEDKAQRALGVIETKQIREPKKEKLWKIYGSSGIEYDDNVPLQSLVKGFKVREDRNAIRFTLKSGVNYEYLRDASKRAGFGYAFSQSFHTDNLDEFNYRNHIIQKYFSYFTEIFDHQAAMGIKYSFSHGTLDTKTFSSSNSLLPWFSIELMENLLLSLYDNVSVINFRDKGFNNSISSRDGWYNTSGVMSTYYFSQKKRSLSLAYEFGYNQTEGNNFDARANTGRVIFKSYLFKKIRGEVYFSVIDDNHYNFASLPHRHDVHYDFDARLVRPITKYMELRFHYTYSKVNDFHAGLLGQFQYDRHIVGGELSFTY